MPNDMENYMRYRVMGSVAQVRMKPECVPTKFECQPYRKKCKSDANNSFNIVNKYRKKLIEERIIPKEELEIGETLSSTDSQSTIKEDGGIYSDQDVNNQVMMINKYDDDMDIEEHEIPEHPHNTNNIADSISFKTEPPEYDDGPNENIEEVKVDQEKEKDQAVVQNKNQGLISGHEVKQEETNEEYNFNLTTSVVVKDIQVKLDKSTLYCNECNILFPTENKVNSHCLEFHNNLLINNDTYYDVVSTQVSDESISNSKVNYVFTKCLNCNCIVHKRASYHSCVDDYKFECALCGLVMQNTLKISHLMLHEKSNFSLNDVTFKYLQPVNKKLNDPLTYYRCSTCKWLFSMNSSKQMNQHKCNSGYHYKCDTCGLIMSSDCVGNHMMLHNKIDFTEKDITFKYFDPVNNIVENKLNDQPVYYRCSKCKCIFPVSSSKHINQHKCNSARRYNCPICGLIMTKDSKDNHMMLHDKMDFTEKDITFKYFDPVNNIVKNKLNDQLFYYRCSKCECSVTTNSLNETIRHKCDSTSRYKCHICGLIVSSNAKVNHMMLHDKMDFTEKDITFRYFDPVHNIVENRLNDPLFY